MIMCTKQESLKVENTPIFVHICESEGAAMGCERFARLTDIQFVQKP